MLARLTAAGVLGFLLAGCRGMSHTDAGALAGSGLGAATGAIIGHQSGHTGAGAIIGGAAGALTGSLIGNAEDARMERDAAMAYASQVQYSQQAQAARALTNADIVSMRQNGVSDDVIIGAINNNGGRFDLSPTAIISMKQQGVDDTLIRFLQQNSTANASQLAVISPRGTFVEPPPVFVPPPVVGDVVFAPPPHIVIESHGPLFPRHHRRHRHHHWHW